MDVIEFVKELLSKFDLAYMFAVNVATYIIIKVIDNLNGEKIVPTYLKRIIAFIVGAVIAFAVIKKKMVVIKIEVSYGKSHKCE